jgi:hypothetical protein
MDIQTNLPLSKQRKGSISTNESSYSVVSSPDERIKQVQKHKKVKKIPKLKKSHSTPCSTDYPVQ